MSDDRGSDGMQAGMKRPPRLLRRLIQAALPPSHREDILGDLEERYGSPDSGGTLCYTWDAVHIVFRLGAVDFRRGFSKWSCGSRPMSASTDLRVQAAAYQDHIWNRNVGAMMGALIVIAAVMLSTLLHPRWTLADAGNIALALGWVCGACDLYLRRGHANGIPPGISLNELRSFHRSELHRQLSINWNLLIYWIVPGPLLLVVYGAAIGPAYVMLSGIILMTAILLQAVIMSSKRRLERLRIERELARLEQECMEPAL